MSKRLRSSYCRVALVLPCSALLVACGGSNDAESPDAAIADGAAVPEASATSTDAAPTSTDANLPPTTNEDGGVSGDDAGPAMGGEDGSVQDASPWLESLGDAQAIDAGAPIVLAGSLIGWTTDEYLAFQTSGGMYALARDGGVETALAAGPDAGQMSGTIGTTGVFISQGESLGIWTEAAGYHAFPPGAQTTSFGQSSDGTKVLYFQSLTDGGAGSLLTVENVDGTLAQSVPSGVTLSASDYVLFTSTNGVLLPATIAPPDGGSAQQGFEFLAGNTLAPLATAAGTWVADPAVATLFNVDPAGNGTLVRASDGVTTPVDTAVVGTPLFDATGTNVYYVTGTALMRAPVASPSMKSTLVASGVLEPVAVSPDGTQVEYVVGDSYYIVPTSGGTPKNVGSEHVVGGNALWAGLFTTDSTYVVSATFYDPLQPLTLTAVPVNDGATTVWGRIENAVPMFDTRVLLSDLPGNLFIADMTGKIPPRLFATGVESFAESWDNTQVAWQSSPPDSTVFLAPAQ